MNLKNKKKKLRNKARELGATDQELLDTGLLSGRKTRRTWTFEACKIDAAPYVNKKSWQTDNESAYTAARKNGWVDKVNPNWKSIKQKSFESFLNIMPKNIKFEEGQQWKGMTSKYTFIHNEYGSFIKRADAIRRAWKSGLTGHQNYAHTSKFKIIKNLDTGEIFKRIGIAEKKYKVARGYISRALTGKRHTACGYRWAYCDEKGNIIK